LVNYRDFPPSKENKNLRMWDIKGLSIDEHVDENFTIVVNDDEGERMYESRVYTIGENIIKILSKIDKEDQLFVMIKLNDGVFRPERLLTVDEYKDLVVKTERFLPKWDDLIVTDGKKMEEMMREYEEEKNNG